MSRNPEHICSQIKEVWPEYVVTTENLLKPTEGFVLKFFNDFLKEFANLIEMFTDGEFKFNDPPDLVTFSPAVVTFNHLLKVFSLFLKKSVINLFDIIEPQGKRIRMLISFCTDILLNMNLIMARSNIYKEELDKKRFLEEVLYQNQDILENIAAAQEKLLDMDNNIKQLKTEKDEVNKDYNEELEIEEKRLKESKEQEKENARMNSELNNLECELEHLEKENKKLEKQVVPTTEYESNLLKLNNLKEEVQSAIAMEETLLVTLDEKNKKLTHIEKCLEALKMMDFTIQPQIISDEKSIVLQLSKLENEKLILNNDFLQLTSAVEKLKTELDDQKNDLIEKQTLTQCHMKNYQKQSHELQLKYSQLKQHNKELDEKKLAKTKQLEHELQKVEGNFKDVQEYAAKKKAEVIRLHTQVMGNFTSIMEPVLKTIQERKKFKNA